jgi:hypothetical protein
LPQRNYVQGIVQSTTLIQKKTANPYIKTKVIEAKGADQDA